MVAVELLPPCSGGKLLFDSVGLGDTALEQERPYSRTWPPGLERTLAQSCSSVLRITCFQTDGG